MIKNIVITGGLGYIGMELCRVYSGESWKKNISVTVIDKNFFSERVRQLRRWNIDFYQVDILSSDKKLINILSKANVVHHLAGITDVAYTKDEEFKDPEKAKNIQKVAVEGTLNILKNINKDSKIIFPSTHVIYDGLEHVKTEINEDEPPCPVLTYSKSKWQNEKDIKKFNNNFIILRLGSVYGYSLDSTRIGIMPNLFSKFSATKKEITLFSEGVQIKSLVPLIDVVRCFKFFEEKDSFSNQTFNLVKENVSVKQVADVCKKINPAIKLILTKDKIPNPGYSLSNKKLLNTGFNFLYDLENCIKEMIHYWSVKEKKDLVEFTSLGEKEFIDDRGKISNYELTEPINLIGYIESKKGTVRANHYHPIQEQKCLIIKGQYISVLKDRLDKDSLLTTQIINEGDLVVTKPNVSHTMVFTKDTIFLNLVRGEREHENYGITHTIKDIIVDEKFKNKLLDGYKINCRCCNNNKLKRVLSLGMQPLANNLEDNPEDISELYPLEMNYCPKCFNCQLSYVVKPKKLFENYLYVSSTTETFKKHFNEAAKKYIDEFNLDKENSLIIDIGSNDGIALIPFKELNFKELLGVEPAKNLCKIAEKKGIKTINSFFDKTILGKVKKKADLILASNVFAHSDHIHEMVDTMKNILSDDGIIIIEIQYLLNTLQDITFDNIYHEHVNYWSLNTLDYFFKKHSLKIFKAERIDTHGGSLRVYVSNEKKYKIDNSVKKILDEEIKYGIHSFATFQKFEEEVINIRKNIRKNFKELNENYNLVGYAAPAKACTSLNFFGLGDYFENILEDNPLKFNKFLPKNKIKIIDKKKYNPKSNDKIIVLAWNFFEYIKAKNPGLSKKLISIKQLEKEKA